MRNLDDQLQEIQIRSDKLKRRHSDRRALVWGSLATCACLALIAAVSLYLPIFSDTAASQAGRYGSLILANPGLGYAVIGILAFFLGMCVTLLCVLLSRRRP